MLRFVIATCLLHWSGGLGVILNAKFGWPVALLCVAPMVCAGVIMFGRIIATQGEGRP